MASSAINPSDVRPEWLFDDRPLPDPLGYGDRMVRFIKNLTITEGPLAGQPLSRVLAGWQERLIRYIYGNVDPETGLRYIRDVAVWIPTGNGKTTICAGISLGHLVGPQVEAAGQVFSAASSQYQAGILYEIMRRTVTRDPALDRRVKITEHEKQMKHHGSDSFMKALSHDAELNEGTNASLLLGDEIHAWPAVSGRKLWRALRKSQGKRANPLAMTISTAGEGTNNFAFDRYRYSWRVHRREVDDPYFLPVIFGPPPEWTEDELPDWRDEDYWRLVNPALSDGFLDITALRQEANEAANMPSEVPAFRRYHLNEWQTGGAVSWLRPDAWRACGEAVDLAAAEGGPAWIAADLSSTEDLTAVVVAVPRDDGTFGVVPYCFVPEANLAIREEQDGVPYPRWAKEGWIIPTPGPVVDYDMVVRTIKDLAARFAVQEILVDPWNAQAVLNDLQNDGLPAVKHRQGYGSMHPVMTEAQRQVRLGHVAHGDHPVLTWCVHNVAVDRDPAGNIKPNKARSRERIDAAVAMIMALGRAAEMGGAPARKESVYEQRGITVV